MMSYSTNNAAQQVYTTAKAMLDGNLHYLAGAITLEALRHDVAAYENDPDFFAFVGVRHYISDLPFDTDSKNWLEAAIKHHPDDITACVTWAKTHTLEHCRALAKRYEPPSL